MRTPPGTPKDSMRDAMLTASPTRPVGSTITFPTWIPTRTETDGGWRNSFWISMAQRTASTELGNIVSAPSP